MEKVGGKFEGVNAKPKETLQDVFKGLKTGEDSNTPLIMSALGGASCMKYSWLFQSLTGWSATYILAFGALATFGCGYLLVKSYKDKHDKWNRFFRNCKMINTENVMPKLMGVKNEGIEKCYMFSVPMGLSAEDFEKKKSAIECLLGENVDIQRRGRAIAITTVDSDW